MPAVETTLPVIAHQEQDGSIIFDVSTLPAIAESSSAYMIFYLAQADEQNGYGTVIQLDEAHGAAIYPDLNPEYTYLFYKDEQGQLQTLLWCIELATKTADGLYIAQAKVHGRGVTEADMQRFNQIMITPAQQAGQPSAPPQHDLVEAASMPTPNSTPNIANISTLASTTTTPSTEVAPASVAQPAPAPAPASNQPIPTLTPTPDAMIQSAANNSFEAQDTNPLSGYSIATADPSPVVQPVQPAVLPTEPISSAAPAPELAAEELWPNTTTAPEVAVVSPTPSEPAVAKTPDLAPVALPPLPTAPTPSPLPEPVVVQPVAEVKPIDLPDLPPLPQLTPIPQPQIEPALPELQPQPVHQSGPVNQVSATAEIRPVGRPPKPLLTDATWTVEQPDFSWLKSISRDPIGPNKETLRAKVQQQIQRHQPDLLQNPAFQPALDQAFESVCQVYELAPTARQDLLKSLLNGRIVENLAQSLLS